MEIVFAIGMAQALFFCFILLTSKGNKLPNILLSIWLVLISISLILVYLYESAKIEDFPHLIGLDTAFPFLYPPILYFYSKLLTSKHKRLQWKDGVHLLPFFVYFGYVAVAFYSQDATYKMAFLDQLRRADIPTDIQISNIAKIVQAVIYLTFTFRVLRTYRHSIESNFSYKEKIDLTWLQTVAGCLSFVYAFQLVAIISALSNSQSAFSKIGPLADLSIVLFVFVIAFFGIRQPEIFKKWNPQLSPDTKPVPKKQQSLESPPLEPQNGTKKYKDSNLSDAASQQILASLLEYMTTEQPFLENQLTIKDIADQLEVSPKHLSQVINERTGLNFFNFINKYRIEEVKRRIVDPKFDHLSVLGIAFDCGFNSKSSFNSVFKSQTGMTPTSYKSSLS